MPRLFPRVLSFNATTILLKLDWRLVSRHLALSVQSVFFLPGNCLRIGIKIHIVEFANFNHVSLKELIKFLN